MKPLFTLLTICLLFAVCATAPVYGSQEVSARTYRPELLKKWHQKAKTLQKEDFFAKKGFKKKNAETPIDFRSEPDRWMWYWIFCWGIGLVTSWLYFGGIGLGFIPSLFYLAGTVFLIIWLVKRFS